MRCTHCNYRLWQIASRLCPECGTPFKPSDFEFVPNTVRFCCPDCGQAYYGTGEKGHLVPRAFTCVRCSRPLDMDEMVLLPADGVAEEKTDAVDMPWLDRERPYGPFKRWLKTVGRAMTRPSDLIRATPPESGWLPALWFFIISQVLFAAVGSLPWMLFISLVSMGRPTVGLHSLAVGGGFALFWLAIPVLGAILATLIAHGALRFTGGTAHPIRRTWQAVCYSSGANILYAVPCLGSYFGWIWWVVSAILMVKDGQRVHGGRAALAVLITPALIILVFVGSYAAFTYWAIGNARTMVAAVNSRAVSGVLRSSALLSPTGESEDAPQLLLKGTLIWTEFADSADPAALSRLTSSTLGGLQLQFWGSSGRVPSTTISAATIPQEAVAYRIADTVFTHRGVDIRTAAVNRVWLAVYWPQPMSRRSTSGKCTIMLADGSTAEFPAPEMPSRLVAQNRLRARLGFPLIPHPADVKSDEPVMRDDAKFAPLPASPTTPDTSEPAGPQPGD